MWVRVPLRPFLKTVHGRSFRRGVAWAFKGRLPSKWLCGCFAWPNRRSFGQLHRPNKPDGCPSTCVDGSLATVTGHLGLGPHKRPVLSGANSAVIPYIATVTAPHWRLHRAAFVPLCHTVTPPPGCIERYSTSNENHHSGGQVELVPPPPKVFTR